MGGVSLVDAQTGVPVSPVFPDELREVNGTADPLAALPGPRECSPDRDTRGKRDYVPLSRLRARKGRNPYVPRAPYTVALPLENRKGQRFTIYVSGAGPKPVRRYIKTTSVCMEQFRRRRPARVALEQVDLSKLLVNAAVLATGRTRAELSAVRDGLAPSGQDTLTGTVTSLGGDIAVVIASAATAVSGELQAKVAAGELTAAEVAAFDVTDRLTQLADEPGAPFLYDPAELPRSGPAIGRGLRRDRQSIAIGMRPSSAPRSRDIVWFAVDGATQARAAAAGSQTISTTHGYYAECRKQASAQIAVWDGKAAVHLWRQSPFYYDVGTRSATAAVGLSGKLLHPATPAAKKRYYDVNVKNKAASGTSRYSIYGGWERGSGSRVC